MSAVRKVATQKVQILKTFTLSILFVFLAINACGQVLVESADSLVTGSDKDRKKEAQQRVISPVKATMMAAALPGLGQVYNRKYWKIPLVYAGFGALGYSIVRNTQNFDAYLEAYQDISDNVPETNSYEQFTPAFDPGEIDPALGADNYNPQTHSWVKDQMLNAISYYRRYRDLSYIGVGLWYILSILEAHVDAVMSDYDISPDLKLSIDPVPIATFYGSTMGVGIKVTF